MIMNKKGPGKIPVSVSLDPTLEADNIQQRNFQSHARILTISLISILIAMSVSIIAKALIYLINLITNLSFNGSVSFANASPADNTMGWWVIIVPALGGVIVGIMALYGSKAIQGHGIPEAMEQILTNQSKIKPIITFLKPISSAISIGTGGPFGAEGPIIATGGALGSTLGQLLRITHNERKILLAAGATAGMSAIFGSPIASIFLAIELLLFEFSPRSIIPVTIACITGAAGHHFLFGQKPVFEITGFIATPTNTALAVYSVMGILIGLISVFVTKFVYFIEDSFDHLPIHWMWYPAIGGIVVGVVGYFAPRTLGVGYNNITDILSGNLTLQLVLSLCFFKFISWAIALGSGTSGGTLAPLLTIGGAIGALLGTLILYWFPSSGVTVPLAALVGMSALFAGSSRAFITSIIFALETTGQSNALLPLLATCGASYIVSFFLMENTIMTEKISRRGVRTPVSYEPDVLEKIIVEDVMEKEAIAFSEDSTIQEVSGWLHQEPEYSNNYFIVSSASGEYKGIISTADLFNNNHRTEITVGTLIQYKHTSINSDNNLRTAVEIMARENTDVLPVLSSGSTTVTGILSYRNIIASYLYSMEEHDKKNPDISLRRKGLKFIVKGQKIIKSITHK